MPVIVVIDCPPIIQALRSKQSIRRSVQHKMKISSHGANPLQRAPQECSQIEHGRGAAQSIALERSFVAARENPCFIRRSRRIGTKCHKIATHLDHALALLQFLRNDVTEDAAFLSLEVIPTSPQFIKHPSRHKSCRRKLRIWMLEFLSRVPPIILKDADVLEARITFQILNAMPRQQQELFDLSIAGIPQ